MRKKVPEKELKIKDVLNYYGLKQTSKDYGRVSVLCPFHDDNNKSAVVDYDTQSFCCFACDVKGDGLDLIQYKEGVGFNEAVNIAKRIFNTSSPTIRTKRGQSVVLFGRERTVPRGRKSLPPGRRGRTIAES